MFVRASSLSLSSDEFKSYCLFKDYYSISYHNKISNDSVSL